MPKLLNKIVVLFLSGFVLSLFADSSSSSIESPFSSEKKESSHSQPLFKCFTGKIIGDNVRMRTSPDLEGFIALELSKHDYVIVNGEVGDFYSIQPPSDLKAYIFRGFVIDDVIEGDRVNVRLAPDRDAPIIAHLSTGESIQGTICENNNKWLEIHAPKQAKFYICKEYVKYAGDIHLKSIQEKRKKTVKQLLDSTKLLAKGEMRKAFSEIDIDRITRGYQTIIRDYEDFPSYVAQASKELTTAQEEYLHRKIAFLEAQTSKINKNEIAEATYETNSYPNEIDSPTERMKIWEPVEEAHYLSWSSMHRAKTMHDFYLDQKMKSQTISGVLEAYKEPIKNKPGDFILKQNDMIIAYVYSTQVNLEAYLGKRVTLLASPRPNNNFAFPAYYAIEVE